MKRDPLKTADAERGQSEPMLEYPELSFHGRAAPVQTAPTHRLARDERVAAVGLEPDGLRSAGTGGQRHFVAPRSKSAPANVQRPCSQVGTLMLTSYQRTRMATGLRRFANLS